MTDTPDHTIELLRRAGGGDREARAEVWARLYDEVLRVAAAQRRRWSGDWTLETGALANEVFIKIFGGAALELSDRAHFFALLSRAIRQILVNYSEARRAAKRGGDAPHVSLDEVRSLPLDDDTAERVLELHEALERFEELDARAARVVELRFFTGLTFEETAEALGISRATAVRDWEAARAWLNAALSDGGTAPGG